MKSEIKIHATGPNDTRSLRAECSCSRRRTVQEGVGQLALRGRDWEEIYEND